METLLIVLAVIGAIAFVVLIAMLVDAKNRAKTATNNVDYYKGLYYDASDKERSAYVEANRVRDELRKVLASAILADKNYLAVDPDTFDALPEDFVISKTTDVGASGDNTILVYQVSPREVGGVKLQNQFL